jgi:Icc-related predicted phosphoesterase
MRLVIASDTHSLHDQISVPEGDIFLHAGDFMNRGVLAEVSTFSRWIRDLPHRYKIVIAGNHDLAFEDSPEAARRILRDGEDGLTYLQDSGIAIDGVRFWGSPWQPWFNDWAFNLQRGAEIARKWNLIPADTDVLVTHGPPMTILDFAYGEHLGCADLWKRVQDIAPRVHAFGHIHEGSGDEERDGTIYVNASICDGAYRPVNPCRVIDI